MKSFRFPTILALACVLSGLGCSSTSASGAGGKRITMVKPASQTLKRGDTNQVAILVTRHEFTSDISVRFDNLPQGVTVIEKDKKVKDGEYIVNYTLFATSDAGLVSGQVVKVTAEGPAGLAVTETFEVTVKA